MPASPDKMANTPDLAEILKLKFSKNMSFAEIAEQTGTPKSTIHAKFQHFLKYCDPEKVETWEKNKQNVFSAAEMVTIEKMMDAEVLKKASFNNLAYGLSALNNINRLHRGQSTSNNVNLNVEIGDSRYQEFMRLQNTSIVNPEKEGKGNNTDGL